MKHKFLTLSLILLASVLFTKCNNSGTIPEPEPENPKAPIKTIEINRFIKDVMQDIYLWYDEIPEIDYDYEFDSEEYFAKLLFEEDKWSFITEDAVALEESFEGIEKTFGWSLAFGTFSNTENVFAVVEFVYPETPASEAGLKRGDIIVLLNDSDITTTSYRNLLSGNSIKITLGELTPNGIAISNKTASISAQKLQLSPVLKTKVIEHEGHRIGYILYTQYINDESLALNNAFVSMKEQGVSDMVIDLRYNPGGSIQPAIEMCSRLAPSSVVEEEKKLVTFNWNNKYQDFFTSEEYYWQLGADFTPNVDGKLGLNKVHFLTGSGTASASEFTITGLKPYMDVTLVGGKTHGKYTASITIKPEDIYDSADADYFEHFKDWAIQPIVMRYANSIGVTDFKDGFYPDIEVKDDIMLGIELGTKEEPLLKAAIEDITGTEIVAMKSAKRPEFQYKIFDRGFSKFDVNKREILLNKDDFKLLKIK